MLAAIAFGSPPSGEQRAKLAGAHTGEFFVLVDGNVAELKAERSLMNTAQLGEDEILAASHAREDHSSSPERIVVAADTSEARLDRRSHELRRDEWPSSSQTIDESSPVA